MKKENKVSENLFDKLVKNLRKSGYKVKVNIAEGNYKFALVSGKYITGGFSEPNDGDSYYYIDGKIAFDNVKCFDKWSKCPYSLPLPETDKQFEYILSRMEYLKTKKGFEESNGYKITSGFEYPKELVL